MLVRKISGYVDVPEADRAAFAAALPEHSRLTNAEPGCLYFNVKPVPDIPGRYSVKEAFKDQAAMEAHRARMRQTGWADITRNIVRHYKTE